MLHLVRFSSAEVYLRIGAACLSADSFESLPSIYLTRGSGGGNKCAPWRLRQVVQASPIRETL